MSRPSGGNLRQLPSGRWQARYSDANGVRRKAPTTFTTKTEARQWVAETRADVLRGVHRTPDVGAVELDDFARRWLDQRTDLRAGTREVYRHSLERWISRDIYLPTSGGRPVRINLGERLLNTLTVADIREWYAAAHATQVAEAKSRAERGVRSRRARAERDRDRRRPIHPARAWAQAEGMEVNPRGAVRRDVLEAWERAGCPEVRGTMVPVRKGAGAPAVPLEVVRPSDETGVAPVIAQAYRFLRAALNAAVKDGLIVANPCQVRRAGHSPAESRSIAEPAEVRALAEAMPDHLAAAVHVAAWSGLRPGEVFALARRHVDLEQGTVTVERSLKQVNNGPVAFGPPKTDAGRRVVNLPRTVVQILAEHLEAHAAPGSDALVFTHTDGAALTQAQRSRAFNRARRTVGREDLRFHDLRHTGATLAAREGATLSELQHRIGHTTVQAAMRYQHASPARDRALADRLDALAAAPHLTKG